MSASPGTQQPAIVKGNKNVNGNISEESDTGGQYINSIYQVCENSFLQTEILKFKGIKSEELVGADFSPQPRSHQTFKNQMMPFAFGEDRVLGFVTRLMVPSPVQPHNLF